jgi:hypothetical protein
MEVRSQFHVSATRPQGEDPPVPTEQETGWAPESVWTLWACRESNAGQPTRRYTDWATTAQ